ncbi:hypothetical protein KB553_08375 [Chryseobacterium rhizoplanae]|uniref:hypothetical protein n=1 Tax=Chryseobacterium rhizoplanae TaxID=1609531 RepID=UPI001CE28A3E|nr:hypothetical protein [Chryseobacterium rhizoplanae]UCA61539.1 hypothetical protein KB553_08375 [Chryseobacterium rhizoplanae]
MKTTEEISRKLYESSPLNRFRKIDVVVSNTVKKLPVKEKLNVLLYSFKNYNKNYNYELCLSFPTLWNEFEGRDWKFLIKKMFPRNFNIYHDKIKYLNTGEFFDIILLNGVLGVSPFKYIFEELLINNEERNEFYSYFKLFGEVNFYPDLRELMEDIVDFYEMNVIEDIVNMKDKLLKQSSFELVIPHSIILDKYK